MRQAFGIALGTALYLLTPAALQAQSVGALEGFGGLTISDFDSTRPNVGGTLTFQLTPGVHVIAEAGRLGNVLPPLSDSLLSISTIGVNASAFYAEGGIRFLARPGSSVTPYGEATAGVARLNVSSDRLGGWGNVITDAALSFVGRTGPVAGVGGGLLLRTGPVLFDVGYRYKQLFPPELLGSLLGLGEDLQSHQVRVGVGVNF